MVPMFLSMHATVAYLTHIFLSPREDILLAACQDDDDDPLGLKGKWKAAVRSETRLAI